MARTRMKHQANQHRSEHTFQVSDMVFLHLQPYKQSSLKCKGNQMLTPKISSPYIVHVHVIPKSCHHHVIRHLTYLPSSNPSFWSGKSYHLTIFSYKFLAPCLTLYLYVVPLFAWPILYCPQVVPLLMALSP